MYYVAELGMHRPLTLPKLADPNFLAWPFIAETAQPTRTDLQNQSSFGGQLSHLNYVAKITNMKLVIKQIGTLLLIGAKW